MERTLTRLYLDHAATTPMTDAARAAVAEGMAMWANPSSPHGEGRAARAALEQARAAIGAAYDWGGEVLLTSGASESLGIALGRSVAARRLVSAVEHDAAMRAAGEAVIVPVKAHGIVRLEALAELLTARHPGLDPGTRSHPNVGGEAGPRLFGRGEEGRTLVAVQWASSETGVRQPIAAVADVVHAAGGLLLVDAAQMPAGIDADVAEHADFVALSAHKRGGQPGVGALLVRDLATLSPTGGQERGYRPGTENLPGVLGYAAALAEAEPVERWVALRARLDDAVRRSGGEVVADASPRHPAIASYRMPGVAAAAQLIRFDLAGIAVSAGSACSSGSMRPSHVLAAMGWGEAAGREVVRVSFGRSTSEAEVDAFIAAWRDVARATRTFAA